jgi:alkane 1-monooxygenase
MKDLKYLLAYVPIISVYAGFSLGGYYTYSGLIVAFGIIPLLDLFMPNSSENRQDLDDLSTLHLRFFDILLYLNVPLLYGLIFYFVQLLKTQTLATYEIVGMVLSLGIIIGTCGINVAHELGHRTLQYEQFLAKMLLLPALYMHFFIEHNRGHHKQVATPEDPASARFGENIYVFFGRAVSQAYLSAFRLERERLQRAGLPVFSWHNEMWRFQALQGVYLLAAVYFFGGSITLNLIAAAVISFLLLEAVNYIEHYGLQRRKLASGRYEPVLPKHSWNSDYEIGRIILYELTRHADHHYKSTRKYQTLRHFEDAPQLPFGYPMSVLIALVPPLWFQVMNKRVPTV